MVKNDHLGSGGGHGRGNMSQGRAHERSGGGFGVGGFCVCAKCGHKSPHVRGIKCTGIKCSECGKTMVREELLNSKKKKE